MASRKPAGARRREIADVALTLIAERGLGRFTAAAVAREVGVTDAALFRHFPSMDDVVLAVIDRVEEVLLAGFPPARGDPVDRLGHFFRRRVEVARTHPGVARLVGSDQLAHAAPPAGVERVAALRRRSRDFVRTCLGEAERAGLLAEGVGAEEATVLVTGALLALVHGAPGTRPATGLAERTWAALVRILRPGAVHRPSAARRRAARPAEA
jgi:AcrR family transcriptional regulator